MTQYSAGDSATLTKSQVVEEVVGKVKERMRSAGWPAGVHAAGNKAGWQPSVETAIIAATAAPEFREHLWEAGAAGDVLGGAEREAGGELRDSLGGGVRSRGRTPTGGFADERRAPPRGVGLPSNAFSPLKRYL